MPLSHEQVMMLINALDLTSDDEITCGECLDDLAEFAEAELAGKSLPEALQAVSAHLELCGECHDEFDALLLALAALEED